MNPADTPRHDQASPMPEVIRLGTRGSRLALWQADWITAQLESFGIRVERQIIKTQGDLDQRTEFGALGDKGIFVKEIEVALAEGEIDLAVHSLKDLPTSLPEGLALAAVPVREDPRDAWVCPEGYRLGDLPAGSRVATGSLRRAAQVLHLRPDLEVVPLRGNVPTRIEKIRRGEAKATLMANAGLKRLGLTDAITHLIEPAEVTPPMGQGALGIEAREGTFLQVFARLEDATTRRAVEAERAFVARIGGGCKTPAGVLAQPEGNLWRVTAMMASPEGRDLLRETRTGEDPLALATELAEDLLGRATPAILATLHG